MAATIKVVSNTGYVEDNITVSITKGTLPSNSQIQIFAKIGEQFLDLYTTSISGTSKTFKIPSVNLNSLYAEIPNTANVKLIFSIFKNESSISNQITKTMYIKPDLPTFNVVPTYAVIDSQSLALTNDNQKIVNGMSTVQISNIQGTAYKRATIKYINISGTKYEYASTITINNFTLPKNRSFYIELIDSRGFISDTFTFTTGDLMSYHKPIITEISAQRDGISSTTKLSVRGIYTEGYQVGVETLLPSYKYQEITSDGSGTIENGTTTTFTITRTPTTQWQDYLDILEEYNNPNYNEEQVEDEYGNIYTFTYYTKTVFESDINDLFETALNYNNKYTQEYLQKDYNSTTQRYYCKSGGYYDTGWHKFWQDTLKAIETKLYGTYIYGQTDKDYGIGGNYEFEIQDAIIIGDISTGFSLDKSFNIWAYINEGTNKETSLKTYLGTAIPAIDVYKDKVALHGLYDENISDSDIQLWGNVYLNGSKINSGLKQIIQTTDVSNYSTSYSYFAPFNGANNIDLDIDTTNNLTYGSKVVSYGDRTNNTVYGFTIGSNVNLIKVSFSVRYFNNHSSSVAVNTLINKVSNNQEADIMYGSSTTIPSSGRLTQTGTYYLEVEEGDFIFLAGFRATKSADIDVIATDNATNMSVEIIN